MKDKLRILVENKKKLLIIAVILLALIAGVVVAVTLFNYDKVPKDALVIIDANEKVSVEEAGFSVDSKDTQKTKYAAKWNVDEVSDFEIKNYPQDISERDTLQFRMKLDSAKQARIMFYFGSENKETEEADYYSYTMTVKPGEWKDYTFDMSRLITYGEPLGLDKLTEISIRTTGWRNTAEKGSVIRFGHIYLTGKPVVLKTINLSTDAEEIYPHFTQRAIDDAAELAAKPVGWPQYDNGSGLDTSPNSYPAEKCTNALYYLTLAVRYNALDEKADPLYASNGMLCKDAVIQLLEFFLQGGNEPMASVGPYWGHAVLSSSLLLIKNTDVIYDELSQVTKDKMDWMMRAMAVAANWGYNIENEYSSGLDLHGNFGKYWNMNYQNTYLTVMVNASMYFGAKELDDMFVNFDYDTYMDKFRQYKFINVIYAWETAGKTLMETGIAADGEPPRTVAAYGGNTTGSGGEPAGTGKGVKIRFQFDDWFHGETISLQDEDFAKKMFAFQVAATYQHEVISENGKPGDEDYCFILGDITGEKENKETGEIEKIYKARKSPFEGRVGMFTELNSTDSYGKRSCLVYAYDSFEILTTLYANMKLFGGWDSSTQDMQALDEQIYVGNEDYIFRAEYGHRGYASGGPVTEYEWSEEYRGNLFIKDIWKNFHCDWEADVQIKQDPDMPPIVDLPDAEPLGGVTKAPKGALNAERLYNNAFQESSYTSIGHLTKGNVKFDIVVGNDVLTDENQKYDAVVALLRKGTGSRSWNDTVMSIQLQGQLVNFRSGSGYARTGFQFESNYRYHVELDFDAVARKYTATVYQIYPTQGEVYTCEDIPFRVGGDLSQYVDTIAVVKANETSDMWVENLYVNGKVVQGTNVKYSNAIVKVEDKDAPNTMLRVNTKVWRDFTDYTQNKELYHVNKETVVITAKDRAAELESLSYCITSSPLSEQAVKNYKNWTKAEHGVACFKLVPYKEYYVYVKSVDTNGNVGYVSNHIMLDPDIPLFSGVVTGKTYCDEQTITVTDKYLTSVTINGEEIIDKLSPNGKYVLAKNSGKARIVMKDQAGNQRKVTVRLSDTALKDKVVLSQNNPTKAEIEKMGLSVDNTTTFNNAAYSAKWKVDGTHINIGGPTGDLEGYTGIRFAIKVVPKNKVSSVNFMAYFGSNNTEDGKMQYFPAYETIPTNTWKEITLDFDDMEYNKSRNPEWSIINYFRIQANGWSDGLTTIEPGSTVYIGYMYLVAGSEDRVHAQNAQFEYVPSASNPAKHDYKYTCCDTVVRSEAHVKAKDSDKCSVCGHDMNSSAKIVSGDKVWNSLRQTEGDAYYVNEKRITISATDNGFGVKKLEYAVSKTFVGDSQKALDGLNWTKVSNPYIYQFSKNGESAFIYVKVTDNNGKVFYASTNQIIYDNGAPSITGITNGTTYCEPQTITVTDSNLKQVTVGGEVVTLNESNQYTLKENCGTKAIVATDQAGNTTTMTVTVKDKVLPNKVISSSTTWKVDSSEKPFYFVEEEATKGVDLSGYKKLSFRMKVTPAQGSANPTTVKMHMRLWSHTYYEYLVNVTPNKWQDVTINLYNPDNVGGNMSLANVRVLALVAMGGDADVAKESKIEIQNMQLSEERVHADPIKKAYAINPKDSKKHDIRYECCDVVIKSEAHTNGSDGACIYCVAPTLEGIADGKTYCNPPTITVKDNNKIEYVKVNGAEVKLDKNSQYTIPNKNGTYVIEAMDEYANKATKTVKVLSIPLGETKTLIDGFTYDFAPTANRKYINRTTEALGEILASYDMMKFTVNVTSDQLPKGTEVDLWLRLYVSGYDYFMYRQKVIVGQVNNVEFKLSQYVEARNDTSGYNIDMADVQTIWFQGDWGNSDLQYCAIDVSAITMSGVQRVREHLFNQCIERDEYRVNQNEIATCMKGITYYKTCICGTVGEETFEGAKSTVHASDKFNYKVNASNDKQHDKTHACCGTLVETQAHSNSAITQAGHTTCELCGAEYFDYLDKVAPLITGIENGKTYYNETPKMLVQDEWLDKVTVDGKEIPVNMDASPSSAQYRFATRKEPYTIVATDYSGNQVTYQITVHNKEVWFESNFDNMVGWTKATAYRWFTGGFWEYPDFVSQTTYDNETVLQFASTYYAYFKAIKTLSTEGMKELIVEFDTISPDGKEVQFGLTDLVPETTGGYLANIGQHICLWSGAPTEWTRVKVVFTFGLNGVTATAYTRDANGAYQVADNYNNIPIDGAYTNNDVMNIALYSEFGDSAKMCFDNVEMYSIITETEVKEYDEKLLFQANFENTASTLIEDGWTEATAWRYSSSWNPNWWEYADRVSKTNYNNQNLLQFYSSNYAYHRVVKSITTTDLNEFIVEFDVLSPNGEAVQFGLVDLAANGNLAYNEKNQYKIGDVLWSGAPTTWTRVKVVFDLDSNGVISTAYTKDLTNAEAEYQMVSGYASYSVDSLYTATDVLNICLYSEFGDGHSVMFDNVKAYTYVEKPEAPVQTETKTQFTAAFDKASSDLITEDGFTGTTGYEYDAKLNAYTYDGRLYLASSSWYGQRSVWKSVDIADIETLTIEFEAKVSATDPGFRVGIIDVEPSTSTRVDKDLYMGKPTEWTKIKIEIQFYDDGSAVSTAYTKSAADPEAEYVAVSTYTDVAVTPNYAADGKTNIYFFSQGSKCEVAIDNVCISDTRVVQE